MKNYLLAILWFVLSLFSSSANDVITKYTGMRLHSFEVAFLRFLFSTITLIPIILYYGKKSLKSNNLIVHLIRGALLFVGMTGWTFGLNIAPVTTATVISFAIPLFTLVLAFFFLKENITWQRWFVTVVGFIGIIITIRPHASDFNPWILIFVLAGLFFAGLDVINKVFVVEETMIAMLFYSDIVTTLLSVPQAICYWQTPTIQELALFALLGLSANLILFFILKAFSLADITAIAPYRYLELLISATSAFIVFGEVPSSSTWCGAAILIPSTLFIIYSENRVKK